MKNENPLWPKKSFALTKQEKQAKKWRSVLRGEPYGKQKEQISLGAGD